MAQAPKNVLDALATLEGYIRDEPQPPPPPPANTLPEFLLRIGYSRIYRWGGAILFKAGMQIDADGSPRAYHPTSSKGLDELANAGNPGDWWALATSNGRSSGSPVIQSEQDPAPGFYVSTTAFENKGFKETDPRRYVDAQSVPFIVLPHGFGMGLTLGDAGLVLNTATGDNSFCVYADVGPAHQIGEGSIALARNLKVPDSPRHGGVSGGIVYLIFPGSGTGTANPGDFIPVADKLVKEWGGLTTLKELVDKL